MQERASQVISETGAPTSICDGFAFCPHGNGSRGRKHECASTSNSKPITRKRETKYVIENKENESIGSQATPPPGRDARCFGRNSARKEEIKLRAYEIYLERANTGPRMDDWLQAERELEAGAVARAGG